MDRWRRREARVGAGTYRWWAARGDDGTLCGITSWDGSEHSTLAEPKKRTYAAAYTLRAVSLSRLFRRDAVRRTNHYMVHRVISIVYGQDACGILKRMNRGGEAVSTRGFTVVETLIVLAVTSGLFIITAVAINGRQQKTDFQVGIRNLQQQFQQVINEAATGYYPITGNFRCQVTGGSNVQLSAGANEQGANSACIFVGKTIVVGGAQHLNNYSVFSLAARRILSDGETEALSPVGANVTAIAPSTANPASPNTQDTKTIPNGLTFVQARPVGGAWSNTEFAVSFMSGFANFEGSGDETGGSQRLELRGFSGWSTGPADADAINAEASSGPGGYPLRSSGVEYCFRSNGTDQSAIITISNGLRVSYKIRAGVVCA